MKVSLMFKCGYVVAKYTNSLIPEDIEEVTQLLNVVGIDVNKGDEFSEVEKKIDKFLSDNKCIKKNKINTSDAYNNAMSII